MWVIPSARNCSMIAALPGLATMPVPLPAVPAQAALQHLDHLLPGAERVRGGPSGHERLVDDDGDLPAEVAVVPAVRTGRVAQDVLQRVRRRAHVEVDAEEPGAVLVVVFLAVPGNVLSPDDALAVAPVPREGQAGHPVALRTDELPAAQERQDDVVQPAVVGPVHNGTAPAHNEQRVVFGDPLVQPVA